MVVVRSAALNVFVPSPSHFFILKLSINSIVLQKINQYKSLLDGKFFISKFPLMQGQRLVTIDFQSNLDGVAGSVS